MAYNFPNSPSNGDTVTVNNVTYTYNSTSGAWKTTATSGSGGGGGGASVTVSETAPTSPTEGDLWFDPSVLKTFVYYNDGTANQWVQSNPTGGGGASGGASVTVSETAPTSPSAGDLWWSSSEAVMYIYYTDADSSQWVSTSTPGADGATGAAGASASVAYANLASFPSTPTEGDIAYAQDTNALYVWDGTEWDRVRTGVDESPIFTTEPATNYSLNPSGFATNITVAATDPEGFPITYSYDTNPTNQAQATITHTEGAFTVTPSTSSTDAGTFTLRFKASDGVNISSRSSIVNLSFGQFTISPAINNASYWDLENSNDLVLDAAEIYTITLNEDINVNVKMWGAGGSTTGDVSGGAGGYSSGTIAMTSGSTYKLRIGSPTGGGSGGSGAGGGYSGIFLTDETHANSVMIAGAGGGGGSTYSTTQYQGAGGGSSGQSGSGAASGTSGVGGSQTAGGAGASSGSAWGGGSGGALTGGAGASTGAYGGGGGGSGYYGGGGGASRIGGDGGNNVCGGGGSGYIGHSSVTNGVTTTGNRTTPANSSDSDRGTAGNPATAGKIIISLAP